ncbi:MAG TPA: right-handed parallel beta-helix repeat-containing protein, partial [Armatimonadota bacterium]|nr:right-handed parallel beta-helix repeat-containing protein [Armatimonadota bacterium]
DPGSNYLQLVGITQPLNLDEETEPANLYATPCTLYFWVPRGTKAFGKRDIATYRLRRGVSGHQRDALFRADGCRNITLRGYGATLRMRRDDYASPAYEKSEWRHCLSIRSCSNIKVCGLTLTESGGDGIYLGTSRAGVTNKNILIKDVICDRNYRQGISVINAADLLIENCTLSNTAGTAPQAGIDFEPNNPDERLSHCVMRCCTIRGNVGGGIALYLPPLTAESAPVSLRFEQCRVEGNRSAGVSLVTGNTPAKAVRGDISFTDCTVRDNTTAEILLVNKPAKGCSVRFSNCTVAAAAKATSAPIVFTSNSGASEPLGGAQFNGCTIRVAKGKQPLAFLDQSGGLPVQEVSGSLLLPQNGKVKRIALTKAQLAAWIPNTRWKVYRRFKMQGVAFQPQSDSPQAEANAANTVRLRKAARYILYARQDERVRFTVRYLPVGRYSGTSKQLQVTAPSGKHVLQVELPFKQETPVEFSAPETGCYRSAADPGSNYLQLVGSTQPLNLDEETEPVNFYATPCTLYFWVPRGTKEFGIGVWWDGLAEGVKATVLDPAGKAVDTADNAAAAHQFDVKLPKPSTGEVWGIRLEKPSALTMEDYFVDLRGVPPLLATSPDTLLIPTP